MNSCRKTYKKFLTLFLLCGYSTFLLINAAHYHNVNIDTGNKNFYENVTDQQNTFSRIDNFSECPIHQFSKIIHKYDFTDSFNLKLSDNKDNNLSLSNAGLKSQTLLFYKNLRAPPQIHNI